VSRPNIPYEQFLSDQLRALGAQQITPADERVFQFFVDYWKKNKRPPVMSEVTNALSICPRSVTRQVRTLTQAGRLIRVAQRNGCASVYYVPVTKGDKS
jgi:hypothetical protein